MAAARNQKETCQVMCFNKAKVAKVKKKLLPDETILALAEMYKAVSDPTLMKILLSLNEEELCVCDISLVLGMSLSAVSHQLRVLRNLRLVKYRNAGRMAFYSLEDRHVVELILESIRHMEEGNGRDKQINNRQLALLLALAETKK